MRASAANFQAVPAIEHFIGKPMRLGLPKEKDQGGAEYSDGNGARQGIAPQRAVQGRGRGDERKQCGRTQPDAPFKELCVLEGNGSRQKRSWQP